MRLLKTVQTIIYNFVFDNNGYETILRANNTGVLYAGICDGKRHVSALGYFLKGICMTRYGIFFSKAISD